MDNIMENLVPLVALVMIFGIPIAAILTSHQRKMAELYRQPANLQDQQQIDSMRQEIAMLRDRVNQQIIMLEDIRSDLRKLPANTSSESALSSRISQGENSS